MKEVPLRARWHLSAPLALRWTLIRGHGPFGQPVDLHYQGARGDSALVGSWRATRFDSGPAAVRMGVRGDELLAEAWGEGAEEALGEVPRWTGLDDEWPALLDGERWPARLRELRRAHRGVRLAAGGRLSELLIPIVISQRVTHEEAVRGYQLLVRQCSEAAPGPNRRLHLPPSADGLMGLALHDYRRMGIELSRARVIREIATRASTIDALPSDQPLDAYRRLQSIRGIGPWTAAIAIARAFGWSDAAPVNDYDLPSAVTWNLAGERRGSDERMLELLEPFRGERWRIVQLINAGGAFPPRIAPRYRSRGFEGRNRPPAAE